MLCAITLFVLKKITDTQSNISEIKKKEEQKVQLQSKYKFAHGPLQA